MNKQNARNLLRQFDFKGLFLNELGWDDHSGELQIKLPDRTVTLEAVAEKRGMAAYVCPMPGSGKGFDYQTRCRVEIQLAKCVREHLIIYFDSDRRFQTWQWVKREPGQPIARREHTYTAGQSGEALLQKLEALEIKIEEEEQLTLVGVTARARQAFDVDRVTKRFYDRFKTEHAAFLKQIEGIDDEDEREWYASIMLNRLKFVYFIQKKGFLDQDKDYLRNRLAMVQKTRPKTKFLTFYRAFLLKLFHDGLGRKERTPALRELLGTVPYLNGGIFAVHPLEEKHDGIDIPDKAFEKVFAFFDQYRWHLDERPLRADDEINPDVLGYIFEKYINQKQMGAYYTKEDITEYIAKNCIVPFIFDRVEEQLKKKGKEAEFRALFDLQKADPDRYIYDPVKHGVTLPLPPEIEKGVDTSKPRLLERRAGWNRPAPSEYALPTEIWREVVARRQRCQELRTTLARKSATLGINDFITLNLNIRQFAQDCIENAETPDVLWAFWRAIEEITVLDPTCGSGAFLFAAVNVLEPLYEACLDRMKAFMLEWSEAKKIPHPNFYKDFAAVIARVEKHANEKYFIFKSIIIRNLYGVDIMDEAVEICKLRLFLKLAAQIEPDYSQENLGIEPLPDIDFNIRAGNTLVGFATEKQAEEVIRQDLLAYNTVWPEVQRDAREIAELFSLFREQQTEIGGAVSAEDKARLRKKLAPLEDRLNNYLAGTYGVTKQSEVKDWVHSHKPFHWFIEFYEIMAKGGFNTIIGNPPYVSAAKGRKTYTVQHFTTDQCPDIYAWCLERAAYLAHSGGYTGMIVPLSLGFSGDFEPLRSLLYKAYRTNWFSSFGRIPSALFAHDVRVRNTIHLGAKRGEGHSYTTRLHRWFESERGDLLRRMSYACFKPERWSGRIPKLNTQALVDAFERVAEQRRTLATVISPRPTKYRLFFKKTAYNWLNFCRKMPPCYDEHGRAIAHTQFDELCVFTEDQFPPMFLLLNGKLELAFWLAIGDDFHVAKWMFTDLPVDFGSLSSSDKRTLVGLAERLETAMKEAVSFKLNAGKKVGNYNLARCRQVTDESDAIFAKAFGFEYVWEDIELLYAQCVRTDFSEDDPDEEAE